MSIIKKPIFNICNYYTDICKEYGLLEAILLNYIYKWVINNKQQDINYYDGFFWMFRSSRLIADDIGGISYKSIQRTLLKMQKQNLIIIGNYNLKQSDNTNWYTLTTKGMQLIESNLNK